MFNHISDASVLWFCLILNFAENLLSFIIDCPHPLCAAGEYVGLTGTRLDGAEMLACGLATHFVPSTVCYPLLLVFIYTNDLNWNLTRTWPDWLRNYANYNKYQHGFTFETCAGYSLAFCMLS